MLISIPPGELREMYESKNKRDWIKEVKQAYTDYGGLKVSTVQGYAEQLLSFCELSSTKKITVTPDTLLELTLEEVEDLAEEHCRRFNEGIAVDISGRVPDDVPIRNYPKTAYRVAPKRLNQQIAALKKWLLIHRRTAKSHLKSLRNFRELEYESSRPLGSVLMAAALEYKDVQEIFSMANGEDSITVGMYALQAFRPNLIPKIKVMHIHPRSYELTHTGEIKWTRSPPLIIVPHQDEQGRHLTGNKASIEYPSFIPTAIATKVLVYVNSVIRKERATNPNYDSLQTKVSPADNKSDVDYIIRKYYRKIDYPGRPYDMRNFGSQLLKRIELLYNDADLKEFMVGHKGKGMSTIYDMRGLTVEKEEEWRDKYSKAVDQYINERIFNVQSMEDQKAAKMITELAAKTGDEAMAKSIYKLFLEGNIDLDTLTKRQTSMIRNTQEKNIERLIDEKLSVRFPEGLPAPGEETTPDEDADFEGWRAPEDDSEIVKSFKAVEGGHPE